MVVSLHAAVAHAEFAFCEGNVLVAAVSREFATTRQWWFSFSHGGGLLVFIFTQQLAERERERRNAAWGRRRGAREFCALIKLYGLRSINDRGI